MLGAARNRTRMALVRLKALRDGLNGEIDAHATNLRAMDFVLRRAVADAAYYNTLQRVQDDEMRAAREARGGAEGR
jgi:hypothetical protein